VCIVLRLPVLLRLGLLHAAPVQEEGAQAHLADGEVGPERDDEEDDGDPEWKVVEVDEGAQAEREHRDAHEAPEAVEEGPHACDDYQRDDHCGSDTLDGLDADGRGRARCERGAVLWVAVVVV